MKRITALALALCMLLGSVSAVAEEVAYYSPGLRTQELFSEAFASGKLITGDLSFAADYTAMEPDTSEFDEIIAAIPDYIAQAQADGDDEQVEALQLMLDAYTARVESMRQEAKMQQALFALLGQAHLQIGAACLDGAQTRVTFGASLDDPNGGDPVSLNAALDLDWSGMSMESDLFPDHRVTLQWESVLQELGLTGDTLRRLRELALDAETNIDALLAKLETIEDKLAVYAAPYAAIAVQQMASWKTDVQEDVPAQDGIPAAAVLATVSCTSEDVCNMLLAMADYLETDENLTPYLDRVFACYALFTDRDADEIKAQFFAGLREAVASFMQGKACSVTVGLDNAKLPVYICVQVDDAGSGESLTLTCTAVEYGPDAVTLTFDIAFIDSDGAQNAVNTTISVASPADDPVLEMPLQLTATADIIASGLPAGSVLYEASSTGSLSEDGLPSAATSTSQVLTQTPHLPKEYLDYLTEEELEEYDPTVPLYTMVTATTDTTVTSLTADGGEAFVRDHMQSIALDGETTFAMPLHIEQRFAPDGSGGVAGEATVAIDFTQASESIPSALADIGLNAVAYTFKVSSEDVELTASAGLEEIALDSVTEEQYNSLMQTITVYGLRKLASLMAVLPPEFSALLMQQ